MLIPGARIANAPQAAREHFVALVLVGSFAIGCGATAAPTTDAARLAVPIVAAGLRAIGGAATLRRRRPHPIQLVVQQTRLSDGSRKVTSVSEITGMEGEVITMQEIFLFEKMGVTQDGKVIGRFRATGVRPKLCERLRASGIHLPADMFEGVTEVR